MDVFTSAIPEGMFCPVVRLVYVRLMQEHFPHRINASRAASMHPVGRKMGDGGGSDICSPAAIVLGNVPCRAWCIKYTYKPRSRLFADYKLIRTPFIALMSAPMHLHLRAVEDIDTDLHFSFGKVYLLLTIVVPLALNGKIVTSFHLTIFHWSYIHTYMYIF